MLVDAPRRLRRGRRMPGRSGAHVAFAGLDAIAVGMSARASTDHRHAGEASARLASGKSAGKWPKTARQLIASRASVAKQSPSSSSRARQAGDRAPCAGSVRCDCGLYRSHAPTRRFYPTRHEPVIRQPARASVVRHRESRARHDPHGSWRLRRPLGQSSTTAKPTGRGAASASSRSTPHDLWPTHRRMSPCRLG